MNAPERSSFNLEFMNLFLLLLRFLEMIFFRKKVAKFLCTQLLEIC